LVKLQNVMRTMTLTFPRLGEYPGSVNVVLGTRAEPRIAVESTSSRPADFCRLGDLDSAAVMREQIAPDSTATHDGSGPAVEKDYFGAFSNISGEHAPL
jgi:hypothetical protein